MQPIQPLTSSAATAEIVTAIPGRDTRPLAVTAGGDMTVTGDIAGNNIVKDCTGVTIHDYNGAILNAAARPVIQRLARSPRRLRSLRHFVDREEPLRLLAQELRVAGGAWVHGAAGCGCSALLHQAIAIQASPALPDGVELLDGELEPAHLDDILMALFGRFYTSDVTVRVDANTARTCLSALQALFVLDNLALVPLELHALANLLAGGAVIVAATGFDDDTLLNLSLEGLPRANAITVCARAAQLDASSSDLTELLDRLCSALGDLPLPLLLAGYLIHSRVELTAQTVDGQHVGAILAHQNASRKHGFLAQIVTVLEQMTTEREPLACITRLIIQGLSAEQQAVLAALTRVGGSDANLAAIANISQLTRNSTNAILAHLIDLRLVEQTGERYTLPSASLRRTLDSLLQAGNERQRAAAFFASVVPLHVGDLAWLGRERGNLMAAIEASLRMGQAHQAGLLARAIQPLLVLRGMWSSWGQVTGWASTAAQASGDQALAAWALHDQGTRAGLLGDRATAATNLEQARQLRQKLGDRSGADASRHNMEYLHLLPPPPPIRRLSTWAKSPAFWIGMALLLLIVAAPIAPLLASILSPTPVASAPTSISTPIPTSTAVPPTTVPLAAITVVATYTSTPTVAPTATPVPTPLPTAVPPTDTPVPPPTDTPVLEHILTITSVGGRVEAPDIDCTNVCEYRFATASVITLHISPNDNATFTGWTGPCNISEDTCTVSMDAAKAVQAHFQFPLTITSMGGTVTDETDSVHCQNKSCTVFIDAGSIVMLHSRADKQGTFVSWEAANGNRIASATEQITMDTSQRVKAIFAFPLVTQMDSGTITVTGPAQPVSCTSLRRQNCTYNVEVGAPITIVAHPNALYRFIGWRGGCSGNVPTCAIQMPADQVTVIAVDALSPIVVFPVKPTEPPVP